MSWFDVVPVALVAAAWLVGPGAALSYAIGLRGLSAWGMAPTLSMLIVSFTAVLADLAGVRWSVTVVLIATAVVVAFAGVVSLLLRRIAPPRRTDPSRVLIATALGLLPAFAIGWYVLVNGVGQPEQLSQTYDAIFHYSALAHILDSGNASSLEMGTLGNQSAKPFFYPAGWHGLTSLAVLSTGVPIAAAANVVAGVISMLVWPLSCMLLVRQIVGRSTAAMAVTGVVSVAFTAFPWGLLSFGVLWPNLLGLGLAPAGVAMVLAATSLARDDVIGRRRAMALAPLVLVACGFAHPNAVFSFLVVALFAMATSLLRWALRQRRAGRTPRAVIGVSVALLAFLAAWRFVATAKIFADVRTQHWAPFETPARAVGEVLLHAPNGKPALWALTIVTVVGAIVAWRLRTSRWLVAAFAGTAFLYVLTAALNRPGTQFITGYWYNDSYRLAAMLPLTTVPLAVLGITRLADRLGAMLPTSPATTALPPDAAPLSAPLSAPSSATADAATGSRLALLHTPTVLSLVVLLAMAPLTRFFYVGHNVGTVAGSYAVADVPTDGTLVDATEKAFLPDLKAALPEDALVANNPWDGSAIMLAEVGGRSLFPHVAAPWGDDQRYLANNLEDAGSDPNVCQAADRLGLRYLLVANRTFWNWDVRTKHYPGLRAPRADPAFELLAQKGDVKLYRLSACDAENRGASR
jgi:multisubunit Na+/H+ antiporter MnhB subunit